MDIFGISMPLGSSQVLLVSEKRQVQNPWKQLLDELSRSVEVLFSFDGCNVYMSVPSIIIYPLNFLPDFIRMVGIAVKRKTEMVWCTIIRLPWGKEISPAKD